MPDEGSLFRPEAVEASRIQSGRPVNNQASRRWLIVAFMTTIFVCALIFVSIARYTKKETVLGQVVPAEGVVRVAPLKGGIVKEVWADSGQGVSKDQPLFLISYDSVLEDGSGLAGGINETSAEQTALTEVEGQLRKKDLLENRRLLRAQLEEKIGERPGLIAQHDLQAERVESYEREYEAYEALRQKGFMTSLQVTQRKDTLLNARQRLLDLEEEIDHQALSVMELQGKLAANANAMAGAETTVNKGISSLRSRQLLDRSNQGGQVVALRDGLITSIQVKQGDFVTPNQTLALIVPKAAQARAQQVVLWVPSRAVGFVQPGDKVRLMFDAFPYQSFGAGSGKVAEISLAPIMPAELPIPIETTEQMYKVLVTLDRDTLEAYGRSWPLRAGMRLSADLVLDEKSLLGWLFDPVTAMRKRAAS